MKSLLLLLIPTLTFADALDFDSTSGGRIDHNAFVTPTAAITVCCFVLKGDQSGTAITLSSTDSGSGFGTSLAIIGAGTVNANSTDAGRSPGGQNWNSFGAGVKSVEDNVLHHIAVTWDNTTTANAVKIYVDGEIDHTVTANDVGAAGTGPDNFRIGDHTDFSAGFGKFEGIIDDPRIYDRALSQGEIQRIHGSRGRDGIVQGLVYPVDHLRWVVRRPAPDALPSGYDVQGGFGSVVANTVRAADTQTRRRIVSRR